MLFYPQIFKLHFQLVIHLLILKIFSQLIETDNQNQIKVEILQSESDIYKSKYKNLTKNINNYFFIKKTQTLFYYDKDEKSWYQLKKIDTSIKHLDPEPLKELVPVSQCIDNKHGIGGAIHRQYTVTLQTTIKGSVGIALSIYYFDTGLSTMSKASPSVTFTNLIICNSQKGEYTQMFIEPFIVNLPNTLRQKILFIKQQGFTIHKGKKNEILSKIRLIANKIPTHICMNHKNMNELQCDFKGQVYFL